MLADAGSRLDSGRLEQARLLIDSGFEEDAIELLRPEPGRE